MSNIHQGISPHQIGIIRRHNPCAVISEITESENAPIEQSLASFPNPALSPLDGTTETR
jgi:hypothetical protein